jgi:hypothetical protein
MVGDETDRAKEMTQTDASTDSVTDRPFRTVCATCYGVLPGTGVEQ